MCSSRVENPRAVLVAVASVAYEKGAPESLSLLSRSSLLTVGAVDGNVPGLPTPIALGRFIRVCGVAPAPIVALLVKNLPMLASLACWTSIARDSGRGSDTT